MIYHVTTKTNMLRILMEGFKPQIGPRSKERGVLVKATYFFKDVDTAKNAVINGLEIKKPVLMAVELPTTVKLGDSADHEITVLEKIDPLCVKGVVAL